MNFGGFIVSDWNAHGQVAGCTNASCPQGLLSGLDMYMAPDTWKAVWTPSPAPNSPWRVTRRRGWISKA